MPKHHKISRFKVPLVSDLLLDGQEKNKRKNRDFDRSWLRKLWFHDNAQKSEDVKSCEFCPIWSWAERIGAEVREEDGRGWELAFPTDTRTDGQKKKT